MSYVPQDHPSDATRELQEQVATLQKQLAEATLTLSANAHKVCVAVCYSFFQRGAVCCSVLQCVAVCFNVVQCVAVCCSVLQVVTMWCGVLQCVAVYCSTAHVSRERVLQFVAV